MTVMSFGDGLALICAQQPGTAEQWRTGSVSAEWVPLTVCVSQTGTVVQTHRCPGTPMRTNWAVWVCVYTGVLTVG